MRPILSSNIYSMLVGVLGILPMKFQYWYNILSNKKIFPIKCHYYLNIGITFLIRSSNRNISAISSNIFNLYCYVKNMIEEQYGTEIDGFFSLPFLSLLFLHMYLYIFFIWWRKYHSIKTNIQYGLLWCVQNCWYWDIIYPLPNN